MTLVYVCQVCTFLFIFPYPFNFLDFRAFIEIQFIMGFSFSQGTYTDSIVISNSQTTPSSVNELKFRNFLRKMIWEFGFTCVGNGNTSRKNHKKRSSENNKAWLLAESGGCGGELNNADPQSVHSSFRFSFCSQVELESLNMSSSTAATVLMVNLDNGVSESRAKELKWRRIESLEKTISPVAHSLIRFSYAEILSATRNFSKGNIFFIVTFWVLLCSSSRAMRAYVMISYV